MSKLGRVLARIADSTSILAGLAVAILTLHITIDVVARALLSMPINGTILFVSQFYMPMIVFLPLAFVEKEKGHINVELLYDMFPNAVQRTLDMLAHMLSFIVYATLAVRCWGEAVAKFRIGAAEMEGGLRIPTWPGYFLLPIGFALIVSILVYRIICIISRRDPDFNWTGKADSLQENSHV